jgi:hypothetical protein
MEYWGVIEVKEKKDKILKEISNWLNKNIEDTTDSIWVDGKIVSIKSDGSRIIKSIEFGDV